MTRASFAAVVAANKVDIVQSFMMYSDVVECKMFRYRMMLPNSSYRPRGESRANICQNILSLHHLLTSYYSRHFFSFNRFATVKRPFIFTATHQRPKSC